MTTTRPPRLLLAIAIRTVGMLVAANLILLAFGRTSDADDADIGAGLMAFGVIFLAAGIWGFVDGRRHDLVPVLWFWVPAAVLVSVGIVVGISIGDGFDSEVFFSDLTFLVPMLTGLQLAPAVALGAIGAATRNRATA